MTSGRFEAVRAAQTSPRTLSRIAGVFYLITIIAGMFAEVFARSKIVISGDAAATAANVLAHEALLRVAFACDVLGTACYVGVTAFLYILLKPVSKSVSLLAAFVSLVGCAIGALACAFELAPLILSARPQYLNAFSAEQVQSLSYLFFKLQGQATGVGLVFFGFYCLLIGYLIFRSTFMPRIVGALMALAGLAWLTFLWPPLASSLSPYLMGAAFVGEGSVCLWLLLGVDAERWRLMNTASVAES
jgi:hypothetical protein